MLAEPASLLSDTAAGAAGAGQREGVSRTPEVVEVTEADLGEGASGGEASIVQVYASLLLGFLIQDCPASLEEAVSLLPGRTLQPVQTAIQRMLLFYVQAGAITNATRDAMVKLLQQLEALTAAPETSPPT
ncbi:uncharacterized protein HaLaN_00263 [Haematococcus lacustris]|uniref:Uncharacterized protein n=1 Tax=Haematococcus lacustris TaxID=44745 RepID=A0A699YRM5_HAELA|nr:uncharacterized protein HaLaN_00263 [Haematococcus lacustris]